MRKQQKNQWVPWALPLFIALLAIYKSQVLVTGIGGSWQVFLGLFIDEFYFIALVLAISILHGLSIRVLVRFILRLVLLFLVIAYFIDTFVLLALNDHPALFDVGRYAPESGVILSFLGTIQYLLIILLVISVIPVRAFTRKLKRLSFILLLLIVALAVTNSIYLPAPLKFYAFLEPVKLWSDIHNVTGKAEPYTAKEMAFYAKLKSEPVVIPQGKPDIILLVVESLSSINSEKTSGRGHLLDKFDALSEKGVLFRNFFANHQASEGGLISLLSGVPPMHFPTATPYMFDEFAIQPSVFSSYQQQGYFGEFLTNAELQFIGLDHYLAGLGFDRCRGRDEVKAMRNAPRIVQAAPSDKLLYSEALTRIRKLTVRHEPFLLVLASTSTHLPYTHPAGGEDTAAAVWDWSLQQLNDFYQQLAKQGYFDHGILIITGDHRQMRPLTQAETERYGGSARARIPLLFIGRGFTPDTVDERFFQQSDLLRMLGHLQQKNLPLSPYPLWVERYNRKYGRIELIDKVSVFAQADGGRGEYHLQVNGNQIKWLDGLAPFARKVESQIHIQRSSHQNIRQHSQRPMPYISSRSGVCGAANKKSKKPKK